MKDETTDVNWISSRFKCPETSVIDKRFDDWTPARFIPRQAHPLALTRRQLRYEYGHLAWRYYTYYSALPLTRTTVISLKAMSSVDFNCVLAGGGGL